MHTNLTHNQWHHFAPQRLVFDRKSTHIKTNHMEEEEIAKAFLQFIHANRKQRIFASIPFDFPKLGDH